MCDLGVGEIADLLIDDPETDAISLFLEAIRDAAALGALARRAHEAGKPVIAYKLGRSSAGRRLAVSHSGAIAGGDRSVDAFLRHHGIPLVDLTMADTRKAIYAAALQDLLAGDDCDVVVAVVGSSGQFHPELAVAPVVEADPGPKFLAAFIAPDAPQSLSRLTAAGKACADAVHAALTWRAPAAIVKADPPPNVAVMLNGGAVDEAGASRVFAALGIEQAGARVLRGADDPISDDLTYPVAVKVLSPDIAHKADVGGLRLGVTEAEGIRAAVAAIRESVTKAAPETAISGYLVQAMETGLREVLVGFRRDPEVGPVAVVGAGGALAEVYEDVAVRLAPVDEAAAREMIDAVTGLAPLRGYRGAPEGDVDALAKAVAALSTLALAEPMVDEVEINPLLVRRAGQGAVAVDGLIRLA